MVIPDGVTTIGYDAFEGCTSLTSLTIPNCVTRIWGSAFAGCGAVFVEKGNTVYKSTSEGVLMSADGRELLHVPASTVIYRIPNNVTTIGWNAFSGCTNLTSVTIPDSVTEIWGGAFSGCTSLTAVTIPNSVTTIGDGAFSGCTSLTSVNIPDSVTTIGIHAFSGCSNLRHAYILNKACEIHPQAFERSPTEIVFGPPPEESAEMSPYLFWIYVEAGILAVVGVVLLGIWRWRKRKARARLD